MLPQGGAVNGYVKVQFWSLGGRTATAVAPKYGAFYPNAIAMHHRSIPPMPGGKPNILRLPPAFGRGLALDELDSKLFKFCEHFTNVSGAASPYG